MQLVLQGKILTPIVTKHTRFHVAGCKGTIKQPRRRYYNKITTKKPMFPYSLICYLGKIELNYRGKSKHVLKCKLTELLKIDSIGRFRSEGLGKIKWKEGYIDQSETLQEQKLRTYNRKIRIRKGLPHDLPPHIQQMIQYALLHDFFHTSVHQSKIYVEPQLEDSALIELIKQHHEKDPKNEMIKIFQKYDQWAAQITRKIRSPRISRYNWSSTDYLDFELLAKNIQEVSQQVWKLYDFIYTNKELGKVSESMNIVTHR